VTLYLLADSFSGTTKMLARIILTRSRRENTERNKERCEECTLQADGVNG